MTLTKPLNIAITGASGYIGSQLLNHLNSQHIVHAMGRPPAAMRPDSFIPFVLGKKNDFAPLTHIDVLIHCAYDFSQTDFENARKINVDSTLELFKAAREHGVKKIIHLSTTSAYKEAVSDYGRIKYELEERAKAYNIVLVRPGLVFSKNAGGIIGAMNRFIDKIKIVPLIGGGKQLFYPCHVKDLSRLISYCIEHQIETNTPIIAASAQSITFKTLVQSLAKAKNKSVFLLPLPYHLVYSGLKMAEMIKLNIGLRSDSLRYMKYQPPHFDFTLTRQCGIDFRPFNVETCKY